MKINKTKNSGNIVLIAIIVSAMIIGFGVSLTSVLTSSILSIKNISESTKAYYMAETGAENGYYIFSGHTIGFEYNYDNDSTCEIESGEDKWCLSSRLNSVPKEDGAYDTIQENGVLSVGLYNDISENPFGGIITSNVELSVNELSIMLYPNEEDTAVINNLVSVGDVRITSIEASSSTIYNENTKVEEGHGDIGTSLISNLTPTTTLCYNARFAISGIDKIWDSGEFVYRDIDGSSSVSEGDIRINSAGTYGAGTAVTIGDTDIGIPLSGNGIENLACSEDLYTNLYSTDIAQIIISGMDDDGNTSISRLISKNQLSGATSSDPLTYFKTMNGNVGISSACDIDSFLIEDDVSCGNNGKVIFPQLEVYALSGNLFFRIESTFSDFFIDNEDNECTLCEYIEIAGEDGTSTVFDYTHSSSGDIVSLDASAGDYFLKIGEYGSGGSVLTSSIDIADAMTLSEVSLAIQEAINNTSSLKNNYSVSYRNNRFQIISTGVTLTNPQVTLSSKGINGDLQQSIQTSITDSSLVPIFGWYSVF